MVRASVAQYGEFLETVPEVALLLSNRDTIAFANGHVQVLLGYAPTELVGESIDVLLPETYTFVDRRHVEAGTAPSQVYQLGARAQVYAKHRDGYEIPVSIVLAPHRFAEESLTLCIVRDMRMQEALKRKLRVSEERHRSLIEHASEVFFAVELSPDAVSGHVTYVSPQARALTGYSSDKFLREPNLWARLVHPSDLPEVGKVTEAMLASGLPQTRHYRIRYQESETYHWVEDRVVPRYDADGHISGYQGVARDVTERWWQQRQLQTLATLAKVLRECRTMDELTTQLLDGLLEPLQANGAAFATHDHAGDVVFELGRGVLTPWTSRRVPSSASVSAKVIATGVPWVTNNARAAHDLSHVDLPAGVTAYASIPLNTKDHVIGAIVVTKASTYADQEMQVLGAIGEMAATALQRQRLHEQLAVTAMTLEETCEHTIEGWARALDMRDRITEGHTRRVTHMTMKLARWLNVPDDQLPHIRRGAMLHDIGKMAVPDHILRKPGPLTEDERAIMRKHVEDGYTMLAPIEFLEPALEIPCSHHERWDGTGYPRGLKGEQIPLSARIFAVVDVYDAITSERPYGPAEPHEAAEAFIVAGSGSHFDPRVVEAFLTLQPFSLE
jgi:PAS domain S-box-containing protein/putative nucleotidyltransferase with HDIG domain